jgi:hypothetical protein
MSNSLYNPFSPMRHINPRASGLIVFKGGGGSETVESIPDWYKPFIEKAAGEASAAYSEGDLGKVAGLNPAQNLGIDALTQAGNLASNQYNTGVTGQDVFMEQAQGTGAFSPTSTEALRTKAIRDAQGAFAPVGAQLAASNQIGGARAGLLNQERDANLASALAGLDYEAAQADKASRAAGAQNLLGSSGQLSKQAGDAAGYLGQAGSTLQEQQQREMDASYQGLSRLGSLLSGAPVPQQQQVSGGK